VVTDASMTWVNAESQAQAWGGHLVAINERRAEQDWLWRMFGRFGDVWIGLSDQVVEETWVWSSGEEVITRTGRRAAVSNTLYDYGHVDSASGRWYGYGRPVPPTAG